MTIKLSQNKREAPDFWAPLMKNLMKPLSSKTQIKDLLRLSKKYVIEEYLYPSYSPKEVGK